jgi:uncharacterized membrane protein YphA (DoxX/SURF4 family)
MKGTRLGHGVSEFVHVRLRPFGIAYGSLSSVILRYGLGLGFLSAVADRLGLWGAFGQPNVEWGSFSRFLEYTHTLNWYLPAGIIPPLGVIATAAELLFGVLLLVGWHTRAAALLTALLLLTFGLAMTLALGVKAPLNFAVFTGVGGALLLAESERFPFSVDELLLRRTHSKEDRCQTRLPVPRAIHETVNLDVAGGRT